MGMTQTVQVPAPFLPTEGQIKAQVALINSAVRNGDFRQATLLEQFIWEGVLEAVASGNAQAGYLAAAALDTKKIEFPRTSW